MTGLLPQHLQNQRSEPGHAPHFSGHNFALAYLLGFYFAPRIPNLAERRLYTFGPPGAWPVLEPFIAGRVDEKLIMTHWNGVLRLATELDPENETGS